MDCPHCGKFVPDANYKCPHCKKTVKETIDPSEFTQRQAAQRSRSSANAFVIAFIIIGLIVLAFMMIQKNKSNNSSESLLPENTGSQQTQANEQNAPEPSQEDDPYDTGTVGGDLDMGYVVNKENPGNELRIEDFVQGDQMTIFDFYSDFCPPCKKFSPWLKTLDEKRKDIVVFKVDINRTGTQGIDWKSPIVQQYGIAKIPHFIVYDANGEKVAEGDKAREILTDMLYKEGIVNK